MVDLIIILGKVSNSEQEERKVLFFESGVQTSVDTITQCLLLPAWSQLSVIWECEINWALEM